MSKISRAGKAAVALGGVAVAAAVAGVLSAAEPGGAAKPQAAAGTVWAAPASRGQLPASFAQIIERVSPAVVSVKVTGSAATQGSFEFPEQFRRFFGDDFARRFGFDERRRGVRPMPRTSNLGSGFVIDDEGHVVTNNHVVAQATAIKVSTTDGRSFDATVVGRDPKTDLAVLKIDAAAPLPHVAFGSSDDVKVGDWVLAIGSPFGLGNTVTTGIVSARGRNIGSGPYDDFLQIDAPINRGNSGGPSFNLKGEVIGVNTAILSPTGASAGIGFAVPADMAREVIAQLKTAGKVARGWLGIHVQKVTTDIAEGLGLDAAEGALIAQVIDDGPAAKAGLRQGDVITTVDGERIEEMRELPRLIARLPSGSDALLTVVRDGSEIVRTVMIGAMPGAAEEVAAASDRKLGMALAALDDKARDRYGVPPEITGVVVVELAPDGMAANRDLRPGDVIRKAAGRDVREPGDVLDAVEKAASGERKALLLVIHRNGSDRYVALPVDRI